MSSNAVFLDRDGVICRLLMEKGPKGIARRPEEIELLDGVPEAIRKLKASGWLVVVVSNQPDVAKGRATLDEISMAMEEMRQQLCASGAELDGIYYCLHHPDPNQVVRKEFLADCDCRKPKPGLLLKAAEELDIDLARSWMVGDSTTDVQAGLAAGCQTVLIGQSAGNLSEAVEMILKKKGVSNEDFY